MVSIKEASLHVNHTLRSFSLPCYLRDEFHHVHVRIITYDKVIDYAFSLPEMGQEDSKNHFSW